MQGCDTSRAKIICTDYRFIPGGKGAYTKIVSLEMAEVRHPFTPCRLFTLNLFTFSCALF